MMCTPMHPPLGRVETVSTAGLPVPWYREVTADQWKAFFAAYLSWVLDAFDFTILTFLLIDIQRTFTVNATLAGVLGNVTLMFRAIGGITSGTAADRVGRKGPLMLSVLWYSVFACLGGFAPSYIVLFVCRALFGIGMGGTWAAGMPLAIEHWPAKFRGIVSGMLQSGYSTGYLLSTFAYTFLYPSLNHDGQGWRSMMWIGILPSLLVFWIVRNVKESPVWLERQHHLRRTGARERLSVGRLFTRELLPITLQTSLMMGAFLTFYYSITFWYPTFIRQGHPELWFMVALNVGTMTGNLTWGRTSESRLGRRGAATIATIGGILAIPLYLFGASSSILFGGAFAMGFFGAGNFGVIPTYLNERFPTVARAAGAGLAYHVGAGIGSFIPTIIGNLHDRGMPLNSAMALCIGISGVMVIALLWAGPEPRGRALDA
jgi:SHS family lactate transporter-like MFS transporter